VEANSVTLDGPAEWSFSEDVATRVDAEQARSRRARYVDGRELPILRQKAVKRACGVFIEPGDVSRWIHVVCARQRAAWNVEWNEVQTVE
jgi:hypothetical protein